MAITINIKQLFFIIKGGVFNERQKIKFYLSDTLNPCINKIEIQPRGSRRPLTAEIRFLFQTNQREIGQSGTGTGFLPKEWTEVVNDKISEHNFHQQCGEDAGTQITSSARQFRTPSDRKHDLFNYVSVLTFHKSSVIPFTVYCHKHAVCGFTSTFARKSLVSPLGMKAPTCFNLHSFHTQNKITQTKKILIKKIGHQWTKQSKDS